VVIVVMISVLCVSAGETLLAAGMRHVGKGGHEGLRFVAAAAGSWQVIVGTLLMMAFFALYALALSWADLSFVLPLTAVSYVTGALFAQVFLGEHVSLTRWVGAAIITLGVLVVGKGG
jgi:drug/metabolite transporter (DMT)-like permease